METTPTPTDPIAQIPVAYNLPDARIAEMREQYMPLVIQSPEDKAGAKRVHEARMVVKNARVAVEKKRKELKEDALRYGQAVDGEARRITAELVPIEEHLEAQEAAIEAEVKRRAEAVERARRETLAARMSALAQVRSPLLPLDVQDLTDEQFDAELRHATDVWRVEQAEAQRKAEEAEAARAAEQRRLAEEHTKIQAQRAEIEAREAAQREERARIEAEQAAERQRLADERAKVEAERAAMQRERELREAAERAKEEERQRAEREAQAKAERERKAEEDRKRREAAWPIAQKIDAYAAALKAVPVPDLPADALTQLRDVMDWATEHLSELARRVCR